MKKYLNLFLLLLLVQRIYAQLEVSVGDDTIFCKKLHFLQTDTNYLGTNVTVKENIGPLRYSWAATYRVSETLVFHASDLLSDTTIKTPYFEDSFLDNDKVQFTLTVIDSAGQTAKDSLIVGFSGFGYSLTLYKPVINKGDFVQFLGVPFVGGGTPPLKYTWVPEYNLSDPHDLFAWASPNETTIYSLSAIDSLGCRSDTVPGYEVIVQPANQINENNNSAIKVYNGKTNTIVVEHAGDIDPNSVVDIYTLDGKKIYVQPINQLFTEISISESKYKVFIIVIRNKYKILYSNLHFI